MLSPMILLTQIQFHSLSFLSFSLIIYSCNFVIDFFNIQEITQQELCDKDSVNLVEECVRFHIHCSARLVAEKTSVFDSKINSEHLTKCLQTLKYMYHDMSLKGITCENEAEFRGYIILLNLNDTNFLW